MMSIVSLAVATPSLSVLVSALTRSDQASVLQALSGQGPLTVFAPNNNAFAMLGIDLNSLDGPTLSNILRYHVVAGAAVFSNQITDGIVTMFNGDGVLVNRSGRTRRRAGASGSITLNGETRVVSANIAATNGVVHVIDRVLIPPANSIAQLASTVPQLSTLLTAVTTAGLAETFLNDGQFTLFAPTNTAFNNLPAGTLDNLLRNPQQLATILTYHVVPGIIGSGNLRSGQVSSLQGAPINVNVATAGRVVLNGNANVISADTLASNGVVHIIDAVILPP